MQSELKSWWNDIVVWPAGRMEVTSYLSVSHRLPIGNDGPCCESLPSQVLARSIAVLEAAPVRRNCSVPFDCPSGPASVSEAAFPTLLMPVKLRLICRSASVLVSYAKSDSTWLLAPPPV